MSRDLAGAVRWAEVCGLDPLLALACHASGDTTGALSMVETALRQARAERFVRAILDSGPAMVSLLESAVRHDRAAPEAIALLASARTPSAPAHVLVDPLTAKELDVLRLLRTELTGPEIVAELIVSINTVRTHTKNIFTKLGVSNRRSAVRRADELGL
jgi:LuxR family maltose regulon positive regulatory protein